MTPMPLMWCLYCSGIGLSTISPLASGQERFISELFDATISVSVSGKSRDGSQNKQKWHAVRKTNIKDSLNLRN